TPSTSFLSTGGIWLGNRLFPDWRSAGHGQTNVTKAIADSVNTFFYMIGGGNESFEGLGLERLMQYAGMYGFGSPTGIDIPVEADGFLPSKAWKEQAKGEPWYLGDTYNVSIGQGDFLVTPLQMNRATAVFASGGNLLTPHLVKDTPIESIKIVPDDVLEVVRDGMRQTITNGSATLLQTLSVTSAGKTGTAQWATGRAPHTWFTGFAPFEDAQICVTVIVEEGANSYFTTPIARDIFDWYFTNRTR
ncbi:MAG: penicillin-binding transpeptidase domain-containing protein, partial [Patescibacteria group bacterium]